jgi:hypothetical protein
VKCRLLLEFWIFSDCLCPELRISKDKTRR